METGAEAYDLLAKAVRHRPWRLYVSLLCGILVAAPGCRRSSSAASPAADELSLRAGPSVLVLSGNDIAGVYPACSNVGLPPAGKQLSTTAILSRSGDDWTILPSNQASGDFQIRFRATSSESGRTNVSGTARGYVNHVNLPVLPFALDVYALLEGTGQPTGALALLCQILRCEIPSAGLY